MSQKSYRRLTRLLFLFLFSLFALLYLLLLNKGGGRVGGGRGGPNWIERTLPLGEIQVSEIRSGGFIVDEFPIPASTLTGSEDFNQNVIAVSTSVHNEGEVAVDVTPSIYGTKKGEDTQANPGLCCGFYHYGGGESASDDYAALLSDRSWTVTSHGEKALELHVKDSLAFRLEPGEVRQLILFFWVDAGELPTLTDLERNSYSVTVKLTSRAVA